MTKITMQILGIYVKERQAITACAIEDHAGDPRAIEVMIGRHFDEFVEREGLDPEPFLKAYKGLVKGA